MSFSTRTTTRSPQRATRFRWSLALWSVGVVASVLAIGAVHTSTLVVVAALVTGAAWLGWSGRRVPAPALGFFGLAAYTALQAVPLPREWIGEVSPVTVEVWLRSLERFSTEPPRHISLSLDPGATWVDALRWWTYGIVFVVGGALSKRFGVAVGPLLAFSAALLGALATLMHGLLGATKVFGLYTPLHQPAPWHVGPLLNANNLAGLLNLGVLCGIGLMLRGRARVGVWLLVPALALMVGVGVTNASRAGLAALVLGLLVFAVTMALQREHRSMLSRPALVGLCLLPICIGGVLSSLGATAHTWRELLDADLEKASGLRYVVPLVKDYFWFGVGRGAFEGPFQSYRHASGNVVYSHAENFLLDWSAGWGFPVALLTAFGLVAVLRRSAGGVQSSAVRAGAWAGLCALVAQNLLDLGLEVPGVVIPAVTVAGSLWGSSTRLRPSTRPVVSRLLVLGTVPLLCFTALRFGSPTAAVRRANVAAGLRDTPRTDTQRALRIRAEIEAAIRAHPADPYFPLAAAVLASTTKGDDPMPWLRRALELDETYGRAHLHLAEVLFARGARAQAALELRLAAADDKELLDSVAFRATGWFSDCELLLRVAPQTGTPTAVVLTRLAQVGKLDAGCRERLLRTAIAADGHNGDPWALLGDMFLAEMTSSAAGGRCAAERRQECENEVKSVARKLDELRPRRASGALLQARLLHLNGNALVAEQILAARCPTVDDATECLMGRAEAAFATTDYSRRERAAKDFVAASCSTPAACAHANDWVADRYARGGQLLMALRHLERAAQDDETPQRWAKLAEVAGAAGVHGEAVRALERVGQLRGERDPDLEERIRAARRRALERN